MALVKPLYLDPLVGFQTETDTTADEWEVGKITLNGIGGIALDVSSEKIVNLANPTDPNDAANKAYVDAVSQGLRIKEPVRVKAAANITLSGLQTIDGVSLVAGDRILVNQQNTATENGIYVVDAGAWARASDLDVGDSAGSVFFFTQEGTLYADTGWVCINDAGSDIVGTDGLSWVQFSSAGVIVAGAGLDKTGNTFSIDLATDPGLEFDAAGDAGKLRVKLDNTPSTLSVDSDGLKVVGLPLEFLVNDVAVSSAFTASNASTLVDGGSSESLHFHSSIKEEYVAGANITIGDPVCWSATGDTLIRADAATTVESQVFGIALATVTSGNPVTIMRIGVAQGVITSLTADPADRVFLDAGGGLTLSPPTGVGNNVILVGYAKNTDDLEIVIQSLGRRS